MSHFVNNCCSERLEFLLNYFIPRCSDRHRGTGFGGLLGAIGIPVVCLLLATNSVHGLDATWNGTADVLWVNAANWSDTPVPGTGNTATFNSIGGAVDTIDLGSVTVQQIVFDTSNAAAYTLGSGAVNSQTLTFDNGGAVTVNSGVGYNQLFNAAIILGSDGTSQTITLTDNSFVAIMTLAGNLTGSTGSGTKTLIVAGAGSSVIGGMIANGNGGTVNVTKNDAGALTLSNNNSYTGTTTLNAGVLRAISNANALGADAASLTLVGGKLDLANDSGLNFARNTTVTGNTVIASSRLTAGAGVTHTLGTLAIGAQTLSISRGANVSSGAAGVAFGATTLSGAAVLNLGFGTLTTLGAVTDAGNTVSLQGGGNLAQAGAWGGGAGGLTVSSSYRGTATLSQANTFTGAITLQSGIGILAANGNAGALGAGTLTLQGGVLDFNHSAGLNFGRNTTVNSNATIISEKNAAGAGVTYTLGTLNMNGAYALTVRGGNVNSGTAGLIFGATTLNGNATLNTWNPTVGSASSAISGNVLVMLGAVTGNGNAFTKNGAGTLQSAEVSGTPFGDGNMNLNGGTLLLAPGISGANAVTGVNAVAGSTFNYLSGTVQLTQSGTSLDYTIGNAAAAADSVLVRGTRGTMALGVTALANLQVTERLIVNGQTTATNKDGNAAAVGIYDASVVAQAGTGNTGVGSFVVADTAANGGFKLATSTAQNANVLIPANEITDVTGSFTATTASNPYALRVGAFTLTNSGTTTVNGGAASATNSGMGGVILNPTATASTITGGVLAFGSSEAVIYNGSGAGNGTIASQITGAAGLTKFGPGTLALTSTSNNYTGGTTINSGTLWITNEAQLGTAATININGGATLLLGDASNSPSLAAGRDIVLGPGIQNIVKWSRKSATIAGIISGSGGVNFGDNTAWGGDGGGGGRFQINNANTYSGDTILTYTGVKDPGLVVNNNLALQFTTLDYNLTNIPNGINGGSMLIWGVTNPIIGGFKGNRDWNMSYQSSPVTMNIGNNNQDTIYSGILSSSNTSTKLVKIGTGTLTLSGNNIYAGITEIQNGTLVLSGANTANGNTLVTSPGNLLVANNLALQNSAYDTSSTGSLSFATGIDTPTIGGLTGGVNFTLPANTTALTLNPQTAKTYAGILNSNTAGMSVTKTSATVQVLSGQNLYNGNTILTGTGAIQMGVDPVGSVGSITSSAIGRGGLVFNGGALASNSTTVRTVLNPVTFTGNATLGDAANTGTLTFSAVAELGNAVRTLTVNSEAQFDAAINGAGGGITKAGASILTLANNNTYTGLTTVSAGRLVLSGNNVAATGGITVTGGIVRFSSPASMNGTARNTAVNSPGTILFDASFGDVNIPAALLNRVTTGSTGVIAADNYAATNFDFATPGLTAASLGAIGTVNYTATLQPQGTTYRLGGGGGTLIMANTNAVTGAGNALIVVGNVVLTADNNFTGSTTINAGTTLTLDSGITGVGSASIFNSGTLVINNAGTQSSGGVIGGTGALTKNGIGELTLTVPQTYTGTTTLNAGALVLAGGNHTLVVNKALTVNGGTLNIGSNRQYVGLFSGTGGIVTGAGGTLTVQQPGTNNVVFAGTFDGSVNLSVVRSTQNNSTSQFNLSLTGVSPTTGTVTLIGGDYWNAQPSGFDKPVFNGIALKDAGRLTGVTGITLNNGTFSINNNASSTALNGGTAETSNQDLTDRVNDAAPITLNGGRIYFLGRASTNSAETLGAVTASSGMSSVAAIAGGTGTNSAEVTLTSLTRNDGATLQIDGTNLGTAGSNNGRIFVTGALAGNLAAVGTGVGIVPGVFRGTPASTAPVPVGYVVGLGFVPVGAAAGPTAYTGTLALALADSNALNPSAYAVATGGQTINSLVQGGNITFTAATDRLSIASGMLTQSAGTKTIGTAGLRGELTSGLSTGELFLIKDSGAGSGGTLGANQVHSVITDNGATRVELILNNYTRVNLTNNDFNLTANNTYTGGTVFSGGNVLYLTGASEVAGTAPIPAALDPAKGLILNNSAVSFQGGVAQQIAAANIVTLNGGSVLTMAGANNTLAGIVFNSNGGKGNTVPTVTGGTSLTLTGHISSTPTNVAVTPLISVALDLNGTATHGITVSALPEGNFVNSNAPLNGLTISSVITNGGFTKFGTGVLNLTGANTFSGDLTIAEGVLNVAAFNEVSAAGPLGKSTNPMLLGGSGGRIGTIEYTGGSATSTRLFTMATGGTGAFQIDAAATSLTLSGLITGSGGLTKTGLGTLICSGTLSYTGKTLVSSGTLNVLGITSLATSAFDTSGAGTLVYANTTGSSQHFGGLSGGTNLSLASVSVAELLLNTAAGASWSYNGNIIGGAASLSLLKNGDGTQALLGTNSFAAGITLSAGTLSVGTNSIGVSGTIDFAGGTLQLEASNATDYSSRFSTGAGQSYKIQTSGQTVTVASALSSVGGTLAKSGPGTLTLSGANTYSGGTTVSGGTLQVNHATALGSSSLAPLTITNAGTLDLNGNSVAVGMLSLTGGGAITSTSAGAMLTTTFSGASTFTGTISSTVGLTKEGDGTLSIGSNSSFAGALVLNAGTLNLNGNSLSVSSLSGSAGTVSNSSASTLAILTANASGDSTFSGVIQDGVGSVGLTKSGVGSLTLAGMNLYTGPTTVAGGTLVVNGSIQTDVSIDSGAFLSGSGTIGYTGGSTNTVGRLSGAGTISPGSITGAAGILSAYTFDPSLGLGTAGLGAAFEFTSAGLPDFTQPTNSLNDVLNLTAMTEDPFASWNLTPANAIDIYFNVDSILPADRFQGGLFVRVGAGGYFDTEDKLLVEVRDATYHYWSKSTGSGERTFNGVNYDEFKSNVTLGATVANLGAGFLTTFTIGTLAVPEPNSMILAGIGIAVATWSLRKRRRLGAIC